MPDDWRPSASLTTLRLAARIRGVIRTWFDGEGVLEVTTPVLSSAAVTDPALDSLRVSDNRYGKEGNPLRDTAQRYLHTSPEFPMKRLLASYGADIYQFSTVFRGDEAGRYHNPEFTLLEWYRIGFDHRRLIEDVDALLRAVYAAIDKPWTPARIVTYGDAVRAATGLDVTQLDAAAIEHCFLARERSWPASIGDDHDAALDLLVDEFVLPQLPADRCTFITDYPPSQAALARLSPDGQTARRFELYVGRVELANGFHELADAAEQRRRFEDDLRCRRVRGLPEVPVDERLLAALHSGLPDCAGVALGFERLLMVCLGMARIEDVLAFGHERA